MRLIKSSFSIVLCASALLISGCSTLRNKEKAKSESITEFKQGAQIATNSIDSSKTVTNERWRFTFQGKAPAPAPAQPELPRFDPMMITSLASGTKEQKEAFLEMQTKYNKMQGAYSSLLNGHRLQGKELGDVKEDFQGMIIDYERQKIENNHKSFDQLAKDSTNYDQQNRSELEKSERKISWLEFVSTAMQVLSVFAVFLIVRKVYR